VQRKLCDMNASMSILCRQQQSSIAPRSKSCQAIGKAIVSSRMSMIVFADARSRQSSHHLLFTTRQRHDDDVILRIRSCSNQPTALSIFSWTLTVCLQSFHAARLLPCQFIIAHMSFYCSAHRRADFLNLWTTTTITVSQSSRGTGNSILSSLSYNHARNVAQHLMNGRYIPPLML